MPRSDGPLPRDHRWAVQLANRLGLEQNLDTVTTLVAALVQAREQGRNAERGRMMQLAEEWREQAGEFVNPHKAGTPGFHGANGVMTGMVQAATELDRLANRED